MDTSSLGLEAMGKCIESKLYCIVYMDEGRGDRRCTAREEGASLLA